MGIFGDPGNEWQQCQIADLREAAKIMLMKFFLSPRCAGLGCSLAGRGVEHWSRRSSDLPCGTRLVLWIMSSCGLKDRHGVARRSA